MAHRVEAVERVVREGSAAPATTDTTSAARSGASIDTDVNAAGLGALAEWLTLGMSTPIDPTRLADFMTAATPDEQRALLDALLGGTVSSMFEPLSTPEPTLRPTPAEVRGFRVRLDLRDTKPPVWRRLELAGDLTLSRLHEVIQVTMEWTDSHLHRFRTGSEYRSPHFVTGIDVDEGEDGVLEDDIRLDQLVATEGDRLWYEYDFGDGWDHVLTVEKLLDEPPARARCTGGRLACPPEDCGGPGGYQELADWVRSGHDESLLPSVFEDAAQAHGWVPREWHPDQFDVEEVDAVLSDAGSSDTGEQLAVTEELAELLKRMDQPGARALRNVLRRTVSDGPTQVSDDEAARLTATYRVFLEVIGDGVTMTSAGFLPPVVVERFAELSGITGWWFGKANREDLTPPVRGVRDTARTLGLVTVRKGRLTPTTAGTRCRRDPAALWQHIVGRLPLGTKEFERDAGLLALAVAGSGVPIEDWSGQIRDLLSALGWRTAGVHDRFSAPSAHSPTLVVLDELAGAARAGSRLTGTDLAVAATARAAIHPH